MERLPHSWPGYLKPTRLISIVVLALVMVLGTAVVSPSVARADLSGCTQSVLPVSLGPGQPTDQQVFVQLCLPAGATPNTVQLLVHGCLYNHQYWEFPDPSAGTDRYSYVAHALHAGYATVAFDMIGNGQSSHPVSTEVTVDAGVWVIHQIVQALRGGGISGPNGAVAFSKVIEVSWSFGTFFAWLEVSQYNDVNAAIFTGATHHIAFQLPFLNAVLHLYPADLDPQFFGKYDPGYLTTQPGSRQGIFYQRRGAQGPDDTDRGRRLPDGVGNSAEHPGTGAARVGRGGSAVLRSDRHRLFECRGNGSAGKTLLRTGRANRHRLSPARFRARRRSHA